MGTIKRSQLSNLKMVCGQEKKTPVVINEGRRCRWVGFCWIDEGQATKKDKRCYPEVVD